jgi:cation diffusion facilitator family transporter
VSKSRTAVFSLSVTVLLAVLKITVAILSGSVSVIAEAINNSSDLVTSLVTLLAVRVSDKPADESHPYGHGKIESLSAMVTVGFLFAIYISVIREAVGRLIEPRPIENGLLSLAVVAFGILTNVFRVTMLTRAARKYRSQALAAEALNFRTDMLSSSIVMLAVALAVIGSGNPLLERADAIGAIVVSAVVLVFAVRLGKQAVDTLLDRAPAELTQRIQDAARHVDGVVDVSGIRAREVGAQVFVDLTASVPRSMSLEGSHDVATQIEERIRTSMGEDASNADVLVHINPVAAAHESLIDDIHAAAVRAGKAVHNISVHEVGADRYVHLDLEVNGHLNLQAAHDIATELEKSLMAQFNLARVAVHIEPMNEPQQARAIAQQHATVREIERIAHSDARILQIHNIVLDRVGSLINLALDCEFRADMSLTDAHLAAEHLERSLRRHLPNLGQVLIHTEPADAQHGE